MYSTRPKKNIWRSFLINLALANIVMMVVWAIQTAFGQKPHYFMSLVITNVVSVMFWVFKTFGSNW